MSIINDEELGHVVSMVTEAFFLYYGRNRRYLLKKKGIVYMTFSLSCSVTLKDTFRGQSAQECYSLL